MTGAIAAGSPLMNTAIDADDGNAVLRGWWRRGLKEWKKKVCGIVEGDCGGEIPKCG